MAKEQVPATCLCKINYKTSSLPTCTLLKIEFFAGSSWRRRKQSGFLNMSRQRLEKQMCQVFQAFT